MKKNLCIVIFFFGIAFFAACKEPKNSAVKYYNTEFISELTWSEYNMNCDHKTEIEFAAYRKSWPEKPNYEGKTKLKEDELTKYLTNKFGFDSSFMNQILDYLDSSNYGYRLNIKNGDKFDILYIYSTSTVGTSKDFFFYNPTNKEIQIYDEHNTLIIKVPAKKTQTTKLVLNYGYYYVDDSDIVGMYPKDSAVPYGFILNVNKLINGKKYMCLNQNKENQITVDGDYQGLYLYEIVDSKNENAYKYSDNIYICYYPSCACWFKNAQSTATNLIGTEITWSDDLFGQFTIEQQWISTGWETQKDGKYYFQFSKSITYIKE